ncbi:MAG: hypothetical protein ACON49_08750 [Candidatus Puniceispirillaceae bacterium]
MSTILSKLATEIGTQKLQFFAPYVWLYKGHNEAIIIKLEETVDSRKLCVNASFARDGSGPLLASFLSMLLIDDCHATTSDTIGVCSGEASVTLFHMLDIGALDTRRLLAYLINFENLILCTLEHAVMGDNFTISEVPSLLEPPNS